MVSNELRQAGDTGDQRRVLMVAAAFPPTGGPGVQRTAKFAKYLPGLGWDPMVWTLEAMDDLPQDPTLLNELPPVVRIHRYGYGSPARSARRLLQGATDGSGLLSRFARAVDWRLGARLARHDQVDDCVAWARASVGPVCELIAEERIQAVYSTFSPASNHLLALSIKEETKLPWVADFRDLWTDDYRYSETGEKRHVAHRRLEDEILEAADAVIGVSERQTEILAGHVPSARHKFVTVTNGFDPADFSAVHAEQSATDRPFVLSPVGRFDHWRPPEAWFAGLEEFVDNLADQRDQFELRIVGHADTSTRARIAGTGVRHTFTGYVSHDQAVAEMRSANALLLSVPEGPNADSVIPAKLFEYFAAGRPILVVGPADGEAERLVRSCAAGLTANFDAEAITDALARLVIAWHVGRPVRGCPVAGLAPFSREHLTRKLASVLNRVVGYTQKTDQPVAAPVTVGVT